LLPAAAAIFFNCLQFPTMYVLLHEAAIKIFSKHTRARGGERERKAGAMRLNRRERGEKQKKSRDNVEWRKFKAQGIFILSLSLLTLM
jgi:hypothetical protein